MSNNPLSILLYTENKIPFTHTLFVDSCNTHGCTITRVSSISEAIKCKDFNLVIVEGNGNYKRIVSNLKLCNELINRSPILVIFESNEGIKIDDETDYAYLDEISPCTLQMIMKVIVERAILQDVLDAREQVQLHKDETREYGREGLANLRDKYMPMLTKIKAELKH